MPYKDQETRQVKAREYTAVYRARIKQSKALLPADNRCCALCGVGISTKRKGAKFCSREHKRMIRNAILLPSTKKTKWHVRRKHWLHIMQTTQNPKNGNAFTKKLTLSHMLPLRPRTERLNCNGHPCGLRILIG